HSRTVCPLPPSFLMCARPSLLPRRSSDLVSGLISPVGGNKPLVTFSSVTQSSGNATIGVAGASQAVSPSNYKVNLAVAGTTGNAVAMPTTGGNFVSMTIGTTTYRVYWTAIGGEKTVNPGDQFRVTGNNAALPAATSYP